MGAERNGGGIALVHDWVVDLGGAERVLSAIHRALPEADLFTLFHDAASVAALGFQPARVRTSYLQHLPGVRRFYRGLLPLFPSAVESLDVSAYPIVLSSSHAVAKGVRIRPGQRHVCYCHTPMRYAWAMREEFLRLGGLANGARGSAVRLVMERVRRWDEANSVRVDRFLANSRETAGRIERWYGRESEVLHPPVNTDHAAAAVARCAGRPREHFLFVSRLVPYKRADLAVRACSLLGVALVVVGDGPSARELRGMAGPTVRFTGRIPDDDVLDLMCTARALLYPAHEDFGIVPVEAQACGTPVLAYGRGGVLDTVVPADGSNWDAATGLLFDEQTESSLMEAIVRFRGWEDRFRADVLRAHAGRFDRERFMDRVRGVVEESGLHQGA